MQHLQMISKEKTCCCSFGIETNRNYYPKWKNFWSTWTYKLKPKKKHSNINGRKFDKGNCCEVENIYLVWRHVCMYKYICTNAIRFVHKYTKIIVTFLRCRCLQHINDLFCFYSVMQSTTNLFFYDPKKKKSKKYYNA